jgi:hypothetical protein
MTIASRVFLAMISELRWYVQTTPVSHAAHDFFQNDYFAQIACNGIFIRFYELMFASKQKMYPK